MPARSSMPKMTRKSTEIMRNLTHKSLFWSYINCLVRDAVRSEPVSEPNSLLNGNLQGKLHLLTSNLTEVGVPSRGNQPFPRKFSCARNRELCFA